MLIEHLFSKEPAFREGKKTLRTKLVFIDKDGKPDDHYFGCLVANLTMADVYGCRTTRNNVFSDNFPKNSGTSVSRVHYQPPF